MANMTFGVNLIPKDDNTYSLGNSDKKWNLFANTITGDGSALINLNASNISSGTLSTERLGSQTKNYILAAPTNENGVPSFRALVAADIPDLSSTYLKLDGSNNMTADVNIIARDTDKFVNFWYNTDKKAGASWRIGMVGSGSSDTNYFVIQSGTSATSATTWNNVFRIGQNTFNIYIPSTTASTSTSTGALTVAGGLGVAGQVTATTLKGETVSATTYNGLTLTAASTGFTIAGGTTSKTLTVNDTMTLKTGTANYIAYYSETGTISGHGQAHFEDTWSSSTKNGKNELMLGNGTASTSNGSAYGQLALCSESTAGTYLKSEPGTSWTIASLQAKDGIIALMSDVTESKVEIIRLT